MWTCFNLPTIKSSVGRGGYGEHNNRLASCFRWVRDEENWLKNKEDEGPVLCGNVTGAR
jgi:hypothetical protein